MTAPKPKRTIHHANCRLLGHAWDYTTVLREGKNFVQGLRCVRCATNRFVRIDAKTGDRRGNSYTYPDNYQVPGGLTPKDRAALRLQVFRERFIAEGQTIEKKGK